MNNSHRKSALSLARSAFSCFLLCTFFSSLTHTALAQELAQEDEGADAGWQRLKQVRETQRENKEALVSEESLGAVTANIHDDTFAGRDMLVYVPTALPAAGQRALLVAWEQRV